jgi:hypothetical protein
MKTAAIYARFSTDLQNERSIEDQVSLCRNYATREGLEVIEVYEARNKTPLAGHGSTEAPSMTVQEAVTLAELTKAFVRIEYSLQAHASGS